MFGNIFKNNNNSQATKTDMNTNSLKAYEAIVEEKKIRPQEDMIYRALIGKPAMTSRMLSEVTGLERSTVCGRINRMKKFGLLVVSNNDLCPTTNKRVEWYKATEYGNAE